MFKKDLDAKFSDEYLEICVKAKGMYQNSFIGKAVLKKIQSLKEIMCL